MPSTRQVPFLYTRVRSSVSTSVRMSVHMSVRTPMPTHMPVCTCPRTSLCTSQCTCWHTSLCTCPCTCPHTPVYADPLTYLCAHVRTRVHKRARTHVREHLCAHVSTHVLHSPTRPLSKHRTLPAIRSHKIFRREIHWGGAGREGQRRADRMPAPPAVGVGEPRRTPREARRGEARRGEAT